MDPSPRLQELFTLYLERRCRPEEVAELIALLGREGADEALEPEMQALWKQLQEKDSSYAVDWSSMYERISKTEDDLYRLGRRRRTGIITRYRVAALVILLAGAGLWWVLGRRSEPLERGPGQSEKLVAATAHGGVGRDPADKSARRRVLHLPDGSTVMLNANSRLDYPKEFAQDKREVVLHGEGYFEIVPGPGRPFIVRSGKLTTKVLGTSFNIRAFPADSGVAITVTQGKIMVMREGHNMGVLTDHQQLNFNNQNERVTKIEAVDIRPVIAWTPVEIGFDDLTMEEVAHRLESRFNVRILFAEEALKGRRITATFSEEDGLEEVLTVLCGVVKSSYKIHDNQITIYAAK